MMYSVFLVKLRRPYKYEREFKYRKDLLADSIAVCVHVECLNEYISNVLPLLYKSVKVHIVAARDSDAFTAVSHHFLIRDSYYDLNHLVNEVHCLKGTYYALVLPQAARETTNKVLNVHWRLVSDAVAVKELCNGKNALHTKSFIKVLVVNE